MIARDDRPSRIRPRITRSWYSTVTCVDNRTSTVMMKVQVVTHQRNNTMRYKTHKRNRIACIRREQGLRQLDVARRLNVYQSEVSEIERGEREPGVHLAMRIARALGKRVDEVF